MSYQNHVVDPTFFYDAINQFAFKYTIYTQTKNGVDAYGNTTVTYTSRTIKGSLQSQGKRLQQSKSGNTNTWDYNFYCKSLYRIDIGDIIDYNGNFLRVDSVSDYDEWGVRSCRLSMIALTAYRDFADYLNYINGTKIV